MKKKNLLVLGASGLIGRWVTEIAKERGYNVTVLVRSKDRFMGVDGLNVIEGNVLDRETVDKVMKGQDAVITCLGIRRKNQANPFSKVISPIDLTTRAALNTASAMKKHGVKRVISISAAGVGASKNKVNPLLKFLTQISNVRHSFNDLAGMEQVFSDLAIDSLAVQPVTLVNEQSTDPVKVLDFYSASSKVSRRDVASWMVNSLERPGPFKESSEIIGWS